MTAPDPGGLGGHRRDPGQPGEDRPGSITGRSNTDSTSAPFHSHIPTSSVTGLPAVSGVERPGAAADQQGTSDAQVFRGHRPRRDREKEADGQASGQAQARCGQGWRGRGGDQGGVEAGAQVRTEIRIQVRVPARAEGRGSSGAQARAEARAAWRVAGGIGVRRSRGGACGPPGSR